MRPGLNTGSIQPAKEPFPVEGLGSDYAKEIIYNAEKETFKRFDYCI
jgi:hypothetical protein